MATPVNCFVPRLHRGQLVSAYCMPSTGRFLLPHFVLPPTLKSDGASITEPQGRGGRLGTAPHQVPLSQSGRSWMLTHPGDSGRAHVHGVLSRGSGGGTLVLGTDDYNIE